MADLDVMGDNNRPIRIRKGEILLADVLNMHSNPDYYEEPTVLKFDRFVTEAAPIEQSKAFLPFGTGVHKVRVL